MQRERNIGTIDRIIRIVIGVVIAWWGLSTGNWLGLIAIVPLGTAFAGWCPVYTLFKVSTVGAAKADAGQSDQDSTPTL